MPNAKFTPALIRDWTAIDGVVSALVSAMVAY